MTQLYVLGPIEAFPARVLGVVHRLVGCDQASFNEIELRTGEYRVLVDPADNARSDAAPQFARFIHEHPVIAHFGATGDPRPHTISDFLGSVEFHRLALYGEFFGLLGIEDQFSTTLLVTPGERVIGVALDRGGSFSPRDRLLLDALRPHFVAAFQNAALYSAALSRRDADEQFAEAASAALVRLSDRQQQVLGLVSGGRTNAQVALELGISVATVKKHVEHILERLSVESRLGAARLYLAGARSEAVRQWWILDGRADQQVVAVQA